MRTGLQFKDTLVKDTLWFFLKTSVPVGAVEFMGFDVPGGFYLNPREAV